MAEPENLDLLVRGRGVLIVSESGFVLLGQAIGLPFSFFGHPIPGPAGEQQQPARVAFMKKIDTPSVGRATSAGRTPGSAANSGVSKPKTAFYGAAIFRKTGLCVFCGRHIKEG
jgi:hypothetical protein